MAKATQSTTRSTARSTRAKTTPNAPKYSALLQAVKPAQPVGESVSSAQAAAIEAVKMYVTAGKRESSAAPAPRAQAHEPFTPVAGDFQNDEDPIPF